MPTADPGRDSLFKYFKHDYPWKKDWYTNNTENPKLETVYSYERLKKSLHYIRDINPEIYKYLSYLTLSGRNRNDLASFLGKDTSTLKRKCNRGFDIILNYLNNSEDFYPLKKIDLLEQDLD